MSFFIGNVKIENEIIVAPMAGISDKVFRTICKELGAGLVVGEMVSANALVFENAKTIELLEMADYERPLSQQIFGSDPEIMAKAAQIVEAKMHPDIIDINMGCPVPKVAIKAKSGSYLLKNPKKVYEIVKSVVDAVSIPVTVKIRSGWDEKHINAIEVAKEIEKAGASAITIHGRTRSQMYSGKVDLDIIKKVKQAVGIPVIGNGDIVKYDDAKIMMEKTGCDAVMIARGLLGNPWLVEDSLNYLNKKTIPNKKTKSEKIAMMKRHLNDLIKVKGENRAVLEIRTHFLHYLKGMEGASKVKVDICKCHTEEEINKILDAFLKENI